VSARRLVSSLAVPVLAAGLLVLTGSAARADTCLGTAANDFNGDGFTDIAIADPEATVGRMPRAGRVHVVYGNGVGSKTITQADLGVNEPVEAGDRFGYSLAVFDATGDKCSDLVVSAPWESVGSLAEAGAVWVIPGSTAGIGASAATTHTQSSTGKGTSEAGDLFGFALAAGKTAGATPKTFIAIGAPGEDVGTIIDAGEFYLIRSDTAIAFNQDTAGITGAAEANDRFGYAVAATATHVAVSNLGENDFVGGVQVFNQTISSSVLGTVGVVNQGDGQSGAGEVNDWFGRSLAMAPYIAPGETTTGSLLAVGGPGEAMTDGSTATEGRLMAVTATGVITEVAEYNQGVPNVDENIEPGDYFGWSAVLVNRAPATPATWDQVLLAIGVPGEDTPEGIDTGAVQSFSMIGAPGDHDMWVTSHGGMAAAGWGAKPGALLGQFLGSSPTHLYIGDPRGATPAVYGVPWANLVNEPGATEPAPVTVYKPGADGLPTDGVVAFGAAIA